MSEHQQNWKAVPARVRDLYVKYAHVARDLVAGEQNHPEGWLLRTEELGPVLLKKSADEPLLPKIGEGWRNVQSWIGGPNPLTSMLLSGALMGGLGYGGGALMHKLFPQWFSRRTPKIWGGLGALGGAGASFGLHGLPALQQQGPKGLVTRQPLQGANAEEAKEWMKTQSASRFADALDRLTEEFGVQVDDDAFKKYARAGGHLDRIETNEWGRVVFRDPFLHDTEKALAAGVPAAAGAMRGSRIVSPRDVASVAVNAGLGSGYGYLGSIAAKFLGLTPTVQQGIQRAGLLAGAVRGVTGMF